MCGASRNLSHCLLLSHALVRLSQINFDISYSIPTLCARLKLHHQPNLWAAARQDRPVADSQVADSQVGGIAVAAADNVAFVEGTVVEVVGSAAVVVGSVAEVVGSVAAGVGNGLAAGGGNGLGEGGLGLPRL